MERERPTILLAAHLLGSRTAHKGSYGMHAARRTPLRTVLDQLLDESLVPPSQLRLHVLYDTAQDVPSSLAYPSVYAGYSSEPSMHRSARLHHVRGSPLPGLPPNALRWVAYQQEVISAVDIRDDDCVFAIDLSDVRLLRNPASLCAAQPQRLHVATDDCSNIKAMKSWASSQVDRANYSASSALQRFFRQKGSALLNCGVVGGTFRVMKPFLEAMAQAIEVHYASSSTRAGSPGWTPRGQPVDMLVFNQLCLLDPRFNATFSRGYPHGTVTMPMYGHLCPPWRCEVGEGRAACSERNLAALAPSHFFTHKIHGWQLQSWRRNESSGDQYSRQGRAWALG